MTFLGNLIWIIFGGLLLFFEYILCGLLLCITIVGIPFGIQCFKLAFVNLAPFGVEFRNEELASGCLYTLFNIVWVIFAGIWIALTHLFFGVLFCLTVIGIPFGMQHFKLMNVAFMPFGKTYIRK